MRNFGTSHYRQDLAAAGKPIALFAGATDELMIPDKYSGLRSEHRVAVNLIDGVNHMEIVSAPTAVSLIADDVAKAGGGS